MARTKKRKPGLNRQLREAAALVARENAKAGESVQAEQAEPPEKRVKTKHPELEASSKNPNQAAAKAESIGKDEAPTYQASGLEQDPEITKTHKLMELGVISSSEIKRKVTQILSFLARINFADISSKPGMVQLHGDGPTTGKAISVVEIVKAELEKDGSKWYQYSTVKPQMTLIPRANGVTKGRGGQTVAEWERSGKPHAVKADDPEQEAEPALDDMADEDADAFEYMDTDPKPDVSGMAGPSDQTHKMRNVPRIVIYLSRVRSEYLKGIYG